MVEPFQKSPALNIDRTLPVYDLYGVPTDAAKRIAQGFLNTITPWAEGTSIQTRITGILLEDQNQIKANRRPIDFFSPSTGLTAQTLRVVSSIFQGSRAFIRKRADEAYANSPWNSVPMPFDPSLANQFSTWISNSSEVAHQDWNTGKASFYRILQQMMHTVFDFPYDTYSSFAYCLRNSQHPRGLGIFRAFFPNIDRLLEVHINSSGAHKTDINGITKTIESLTHLQANTSQLKVADILSKLLYDRSRKGTVYTNAKLPDVIKSLRKLAALGKADISPSELAVELEILSNPTTPITEKRVEELKRRVSPNQLVIQPTREKTKFETVSKGELLSELEHEDNFWNPIYAGLLLNLVETALRRR